MAVPAVAPLVRHEEGVLRDPVYGVEGGEDQREGGHAHEVQQLDPPLQPLSLKLHKVSMARLIENIFSIRAQSASKPQSCEKVEEITKNIV